MFPTRSAAVIAASAALEVGTAATLIVNPSLFSWLLFGADMTLAGQALGRLSGIALLALAVACWPRGRSDAGSRPAVQAMLLFSVLAAAGLLFLGIGGLWSECCCGRRLWRISSSPFCWRSAGPGYVRRSITTAAVARDRSSVSPSTELLAGPPNSPTGVRYDRRAISVGTATR